MPIHWTKKGWAALSKYERNRALLIRAKEIMQQTRLGSLMTIKEAKTIAAREIRKSIK
jgi:hypothetical protein